MGIDHFGPVFAWSDAVHPVIFIGKATARPSEIRDTHVFERIHNVIPDATGIGNGGMLANPNATVNAVAQVFRKVAIYMPAYCIGGNIGIQDHPGGLTG